MQDFTTESYTFSFPTYIRFGCGVINELAEHLKAQGIKKPLLVTDPGLAKLDIISSIMQQLFSQQLDAVLFHDIAKNPVKSNVLAGVRAFQQNHCDAVIGVGGGASIDVARAIVLKVNHSLDLFDYVELKGGDKLITESVPYFVAIPTTSGTGSEVGRSAVISDDETHQKNVLFHPSLLAKAVFADPDLTMNLPPMITAATGMDALTHNIEAYLSKGFHPLCDGIALEGMRLIHESIEEAVVNPNRQSRAKMMAAALMGAVAFQKGLGLVHSMAHALSTHKDLHHGLANALMLPAGIEHNRKFHPEKIKYIEDHLNLNESLSDYIKQLNRKINLPENLASQGIGEDDINTLAHYAALDGCHQCHDFKVTESDFKQLFKEALH